MKPKILLSGLYEKKFLIPVIDYTSAKTVIIGKLGKKPIFLISQGGSSVDLHHRSEHLYVRPALL